MIYPKSGAKTRWMMTGLVTKGGPEFPHFASVTELQAGPRARGAASRERLEGRGYGERATGRTVGTPRAGFCGTSNARGRPSREFRGEKTYESR